MLWFSEIDVVLWWCMKVTSQVKTGQHWPGHEPWALFNFSWLLLMKTLYNSHSWLHHANWPQQHAIFRTKQQRSVCVWLSVTTTAWVVAILVQWICNCRHHTSPSRSSTTQREETITLHLCHNVLDEGIWKGGGSMHFLRDGPADGSIPPVFQSWSDSQHGRARLNGRLHANVSSVPILYSSSLTPSSCPCRHFVFLLICSLHRLPFSVLLPFTLPLFLSDSSGAPLGGN